MKKQYYIGILLILLLFFTACTSGDGRTPEQIAQEFANLLNADDYAQLYFLMDPELSTNANAPFDFVKNALCQREFYTNSASVDWIYERVVMQDKNTAYAYYTLSTTLIEKKSPGIKLVKSKDGWRVSTFYEYFNHEKAEQCRKDLDEATK